MSDEPRTSSRRTLLVLLAVFALPLGIAWILAAGPAEWRPSSTLNHGLLLDTPIQLQSFGIADHSGSEIELNAGPGDWMLVVAHVGACTVACQELVEVAQRLRIAVGRDTPRVRVASLGPVQPSASEQDHSQWTLPPESAFFKTLARITGTSPQTQMLLVDSRGQVVLMYPDSEDGQGALKDLKRLLRATAPP